MFNLSAVADVLLTEKMDNQTLQYYESNANNMVGRYNNAQDGISRYFQQSFDRNGKILDIGCGSGRDLNILHEMGYAADGIDPCDEFVEICLKNITAYASVVKKDSLPELREISDKTYDGVLCSAVLMHLPKEQLFDASFAIRRILKDNGRFLMSIPLHDETIDEKTRRDSFGRLFNSITPENFQLIFERIGFSLISRWDNDDSLGREHRKWATMLFKLDSASGSRPIDTIESVLNKDRKVATYKLALFRALAELATTNYNLVHWERNGDVHVPVSRIAEKWIEYYWPIFESDKFIPQIQAEVENGKPVAFRKLLTTLIQASRSTGGLSGFANLATGLRNKSLPEEINLIHQKLLRKLKDTIVDGPVKHSGGAGGNTVFKYKKGHVAVPPEIWRELSLMGYWIQDATILRWAELTSRISKNSIRPSEVIECLLTVPIPEREVSMAKSLYDSLSEKRCVWTDKVINNEYAVDHAIPFCLWKNNDLWNLFPANQEVNNKKSDKLPTNELIKKRKDVFIFYWEISKNKYPDCFNYEVSKLIGQELSDLNEGWENILFAKFMEAIEITAIQRGVERWQPVNFAAIGINEASLHVKTDMEILLEEKNSDNFDEKSRILEMEKEEAPSKIAVLFFSDLKVACSAFKSELSRNDYDVETIEVENPHGNLDTKRHFVVQASGNSMDGGNAPIRDGDMLLLEKNNGGTVSNQIFAVEYNDGFGGTSYALKRVEKDAPGSYRLVSANINYPDIPVDPENMFPFARLKKNLGRIIH